jgi:hypothetical protein
MNQLRAEVINKSCAFVLQITDPGETLKKLSMFFQDRKIAIDSFNLQRHRDGDASVIIHCQIEKDRISRTVHLLEQMPGVIELERMEGK